MDTTPPTDPAPVERWPAIYIDVHCFDCGRIIFSERYRQAAAENWAEVSAHWRRSMEWHRTECVGDHLEELRGIATLLRMMLTDGTIPPDSSVARHLAPLVNRIAR